MTPSREPAFPLGRPATAAGGLPRQESLAWLAAHRRASPPRLPDAARCPRALACLRRELAAIAKEADAGLHVDCCLGSYMMPFARSVGGRDIPDFDFR